MSQEPGISFLTALLIECLCMMLISGIMLNLPLPPALLLQLPVLQPVPLAPVAQLRVRPARVRAQAPQLRPHFSGN